MNPRKKKVDMTKVLFDAVLRKNLVVWLIFYTIGHLLGILFSSRDMNFIGKLFLGILGTVPSVLLYFYVWIGYMILIYIMDLILIVGLKMNLATAFTIEAVLLSLPLLYLIFDRPGLSTYWMLYSISIVGIWVSQKYKSKYVESRLST